MYTLYITYTFHKILYVQLIFGTERSRQKKKEKQKNNYYYTYSYQPSLREITWRKVKKIKVWRKMCQKMRQKRIIYQTENIQNVMRFKISMHHLFHSNNYRWIEFLSNLFVWNFLWGRCKISNPHGTS